MHRMNVWTKFTKPIQYTLFYKGLVRIAKTQPMALPYGLIQSFTHRRSDCRSSMVLRGGNRHGIRRRGHDNHRKS